VPRQESLPDGARGLLVQLGDTWLRGAQISKQGNGDRNAATWSSYELVSVDYSRSLRPGCCR
jgi:hypothetical protein